jgi:hypothetical protein
MYESKSLLRLRCREDTARMARSRVGQLTASWTTAAEKDLSGSQ